ncbi:MAG TPA: hypothetical protein VK929_09200 [Longimicrobiales bacterium]|nr:hypothetical protein [Longimicrobiales bacterium]
MAALAVAGLMTACGDVGDDDDVLQQDTTLMIQPDTMLIERTITEDTIRDPDLSRDTARDTMQDTIPN